MCMFDYVNNNKNINSKHNNNNNYYNNCTNINKINNKSNHSWKDDAEEVGSVKKKKMKHLFLYHLPTTENIFQTPRQKLISVRDIDNTEQRIPARHCCVFFIRLAMNRVSGGGMFCFVFVGVCVLCE